MNEGDVVTIGDVTGTVIAVHARGGVAVRLDNGCILTLTVTELETFCNKDDAPPVSTEEPTE